MKVKTPREPTRLLGNKDTTHKNSSIMKYPWGYMDKVWVQTIILLNNQYKLFSLRCLTRDYLEEERNTIIWLLYKYLK